MILQEEFQYVGRSSPVGCPAGYEYYLLVYAAAAAEPAKGGHRVRIRTRLACTRDASFYGFATGGSAALGEHSLYGWTRRQIPGSYWGDSQPLTEAGISYPRWTELAEGEALIPGTLAGGELPLTGSWVMESSLDRAWFPDTGEPAEFCFPVTLAPGPGLTEVTLSRPSVPADGRQTLTLTLKSPVPGVTFLVEARMGDRQVTEPAAVSETCSFTLPREVWLPLLTDAADTASLADTEAPNFRITALDALGAPVENRRVRFDFTVPEDCVPLIQQWTLSPVSLLPPPFDGRYLQSLCRVRSEVTAWGIWGSRLTALEMTLEGKTYPAREPAVSDPLAGSGPIKARLTVTDSRGLRAVREETLEVLPYLRPVLLLEAGYRSDLDGNAAPGGQRLWLKATGSCTEPEGLDNRCCLELRWKEQEGVFCDWLPLTELNGPATAFAGIPEGAVLDPRYGYRIRLRCRDSLGGCTETEFTVPRETVYMHRTPTGLGLGKYVEEEQLLDCQWNVWLRGSLRLGDQGRTLEEYIRSIIAGG